MTPPTTAMVIGSLSLALLAATPTHAASSTCEYGDPILNPNGVPANVIGYTTVVKGLSYPECRALVYDWGRNKDFFKASSAEEEARLNALWKGPTAVVNMEEFPSCTGGLWAPRYVEFPIWRCFRFVGRVYDPVFKVDYYGISWAGQRGGDDKSYVVRLAPAASAAESATILGSTEPGQTINLVATVYDQTGQAVLNVPLKLTSTVIADSGGHSHHVGSARPPGTLSRLGTPSGPTLTGNTGANGLSFRFTAPALAGDYTLTAQCTDGKTCAQDGPRQLWVGIKGLLDIPPGHYDLTDSTGKIVGWTAEHPDNHYLSGPALDRLWEFGYRYSVVRFPLERRLQLNDASLERGGVFDITLNWKSPHREHCRGAVVDVRANGGDGTLNIRSDTDKRIDEVHGLANEIGIDAFWDVPRDTDGVRVWSLRHFHLRLLGTEGLSCP